MIKGDFHIHSTYSDGQLNIKELIDLYKKTGFNVIAITDHDNTDGCEEAIEYGKLNGITVIPGIEVSTKYNGEHIHILGYFNGDDYKRKEIIDYSKEKAQSRKNRCYKMVKALKENFGIEIDAEKLLSKAKGRIIGRPHIAKEILEAGYGKDIKDIFDKYLGEDSPVYMPSSALTPQEGITLLRNNNVVVVLAHPILLKNLKAEDVLDSFDFDGLEAIHDSNTDEDTEKFINLGNKRGLLITAGSDFHDFQFLERSGFGTITLDPDNIKKLIDFINNI